jgi:hypothetical protein
MGGVFMAIRTKSSRVLVSIAAVATGILLGSTLGAKAKVNVADPSKASAGAFGTVDVDPGALAANDCTSPTAPAPGVKVGDHVVVGAPHDLEPELVGTVFAPVVGDLLSFRICNVSAAPVTPAKRTWTYMVVR